MKKKTIFSMKAIFVADSMRICYYNRQKMLSRPQDTRFVYRRIVNMRVINHDMLASEMRHKHTPDVIIKA